tara:strand:+ start:252 stop:710 length:459 start_codon:yes stop_codon:yes gene_type:complete
MSNLISVTQRGPDILDPVRDAVGSSYGQKIVGDVRKAGAVLKSNPMGLLISELIFPPAVADGTLKGKPIYEDKSYDIMDEIPRNIGSPKVFPKPQDPNIRTMEFRDVNGNGIDDRDETSGLLQIDPAVQNALDLFESQRRAGISGTFVAEQS